MVHGVSLFLKFIIIRFFGRYPWCNGTLHHVVGNGHDDTSSNPGRDIAFQIALIPLGKV